MFPKEIGSAIRLLAILSIVALAPIPTQASPIPLTFTGVNGESSYGYYIDPYIATVNGVTGTQIWCIDFAHEVNFGDTYTVYTTPVTGSDYSKTYLYNPHTPDVTSTKYKEIAWLISEYPSGPGNDAAQTRAAIQWVIWDISSGQNHSAYYPDQYAYWMKEAQASFDSGNYTGWQILTDSTGAGHQEFMTQNAVPEPGTMVLVGSGLLALWGLRKKYQNKTRPKFILQ